MGMPPWNDVLWKEREYPGLCLSRGAIQQE
jgi:hypothetical protein